MEAIEQVFRTRRVSLNLTQEAVAERAGVSRKTVSDFENGAGRINLGNLQRLLRAVGLELGLREASLRPTLDELAGRYSGEEAQKVRLRARRKATP